MSPQGPTSWTMITISGEFSQFQVKLWYHMHDHMFSSMKTEGYMESELSSTFWVKLVAKNIGPGCIRPQCGASSEVWWLSEGTCKFSVPGC